VNKKSIGLILYLSACSGLMGSRGWTQSGGLPHPDLFTGPSRSSTLLRHPDERLLTWVSLGPTIDRMVTLRSVHLVEPGGKADMADEVEYDVRYFPTAIAKANNSEIYIAGQLESGTTIIDRWQVGRPEYSEQFIISTGETLRTLTAAPVPSRVRVYAAALPGRNGVLSMTFMPGTAQPSLLVYFHDSRDVCSFNLTEKTFTLVATSGTGVQGVLSVPALDLDWNNVLLREHISGGYYYIFDRSKEYVDDDETFVVLRDTDKDGVLNLAEEITVADWLSAELDKAGAWVQSNSWAM